MIDTQDQWHSTFEIEIKTPGLCVYILLLAAGNHLVRSGFVLLKLSTCSLWTDFRYSVIPPIPQGYQTRVQQLSIVLVEEGVFNDYSILHCYKTIEVE
jgi:hypothetical protein